MKLGDERLWPSHSVRGRAAHTPGRGNGTAGAAVGAGT